MNLYTLVMFSFLYLEILASDPTPIGVNIEKEPFIYRHCETRAFRGFDTGFIYLGPNFSDCTSLASYSSTSGLTSSIEFAKKLALFTGKKTGSGAAGAQKKLLEEPLPYAYCSGAAPGGGTGFT